MKNLIPLLLSAVALVVTSCAQSKEAKAEKLVKETLKEYLYHPDSYEPIYTSVDSMFVDVATIEPIMQISDDIESLMSKIRRCKTRIEISESSMDIWTPNGYSTSYTRGEYERAKRDKEKAESNLDKYNRKLSEQIASLKKNVSKYHKGEFVGWVIFHRFKSLDGAGTNTVPGEMIFFSDEEFTNCTGFEAYKLDKFTNILKAVDEATSDEDIRDFFEGN